MLKTIIPVALAFAVTAPTIADAQSSALRRDTFTLPVAQIGPNTFEVIEADGAGGTQMWCGAGIYVRRVLGQRGGDIQIVTPRGPSTTMPGRKSVVFTTEVSGEGGGGFFSPSTRTAGRSVSMTHAFALCSDMPRLRLRTQDGQLVRRGI